MGKYFCFNSSLKQSISLLRRGARVELSRRAGTALRPRGPRLRRGGAPKGRLIGLTGEKTFFVRAPAKSYSNAEHAFERFRYLRRGARVELSRRAGTALKPRRLPTKAKKTPAKAPAGPPAGRAMLRIAGACRKRKTGTENPSKTPNGCQRHPDGEKTH